MLEHGPRRLVHADAGMTLVEVLAVMVVLLVGVLGTVMLFDGSNAATAKTRAREAATNLTRELTEATRGVPYAQITPAGLPGMLALQPGLEDHTAGGAYTIIRRNVAYTVQTDVCIMDEGRDGGGDQSGGGFCPDSVAANTPRPGGGPDRNPEDYKRVTVTLTWRERDRTYRQTQTAIINNPGSIAGPGITSLSLLGSPSPLPHIVDDAADGSPSWVVPTNEADVLFTTSAVPASTNWLLDGAIQGVKPVPYDGTGKAFVARWNFDGLYDGTYVVAAEAYDKWGVAGPGRSLTVLLNRFTPAAPSNVAGGISNGVVELEWSTNKDRDILGYTVERELADGTWSQVCPATGIGPDTWCVDESPVGDRYRVKAWDRAPDGTTRAGAASGVLQVSPQNQPPEAISDLSYTIATDGKASISWTRPADPEGDAIAFYRIYRGGTTRADRYETWADSGPNVTWTNAVPGHTYYVTAVDVSYAESAPAMVTLP